MTVNYEVLTDFQLSQNREGPFKLFVYEADGRHLGSIVFQRSGHTIGENELDCEEARVMARANIAVKKEVRITDFGDMLLFHAKDGNILFPKEGDFWREIGCYSAAEEGNHMAGKENTKKAAKSEEQEEELETKASEKTEEKSEEPEHEPYMIKCVSCGVWYNRHNGACSNCNTRAPIIAGVTP